MSISRNDLSRQAFHTSQLILSALVETAPSGANLAETASFLSEIDNRILEIDSEAVEVIEPLTVDVTSTSIQFRVGIGQVQRIRAVRRALFGSADGTQVGAIPALKQALMSEVIG